MLELLASGVTALRAPSHEAARITFGPCLPERLTGCHVFRSYLADWLFRDLQFLANLGWFQVFEAFLPSSLIFPVYRAGQDSSGALPIAFRSCHGGHELGADVAFLVHEVETSHHVGTR